MWDGVWYTRVVVVLQARKWLGHNFFSFFSYIISKSSQYRSRQCRSGWVPKSGSPASSSNLHFSALIWGWISRMHSAAVWSKIMLCRRVRPSLCFQISVSLCKSCLTKKKNIIICGTVVGHDYATGLPSVWNTTNFGCVHHSSDQCTIFYVVTHSVIHQFEVWGVISWYNAPILLSLFTWMILFEF